ncbi:MAG: hypothetical protein ACH0QD_05405 [Tepidibacillus sp.]
MKITGNINKINEEFQQFLNNISPLLHQEVYTGSVDNTPEANQDDEDALLYYGFIFSTKPMYVYGVANKATDQGIIYISESNHSYVDIFKDMTKAIINLFRREENQKDLLAIWGKDFNKLLRENGELFDSHKIVEDKVEGFAKLKIEFQSNPFIDIWTFNAIFDDIKNSMYFIDEEHKKNFEYLTTEIFPHAEKDREYKVAAYILSHPEIYKHCINDPFFKEFPFLWTNEYKDTSYKEIEDGQEYNIIDFEIKKDEAGNHMISEAYGVLSSGYQLLVDLGANLFNSSNSFNLCRAIGIWDEKLYKIFEQSLKIKRGR